MLGLSCSVDMWRVRPRPRNVHNGRAFGHGEWLLCRVGLTPISSTAFCESSGGPGLVSSLFRAPENVEWGDGREWDKSVAAASVLGDAWLLLCGVTAVSVW